LGFKKDLKLGKTGEEEVIKLLEQHKIKCKINEDKKTRIYHDIVGSTKKGEFSIEVKYDEYCAKSGNIAIEYYNSSKEQESGIDITSATFWAHLTPNQSKIEIWITPVSFLKLFIKENKPLRTITNAGDGNASIYLYKKNIIMPAIFYNVKEYDTKSLRKLINEHI